MAAEPTRPSGAMPARECCRPGLSLATALLLGLVAASAHGGGLVPANFNLRVDSMGFMWDIDPTGTVRDGSDDCFDNGLALSVNGASFHAAQPMMTPDGSEFVLSAPMGTGLEVTRRIKVDHKRSGARYVEMVENTGRAAANVSLTITSQLGGSCQLWLSDTGASSPMALGKKDSGIVAVQQGTSRPSVAWVLAGARSKVKPALSVQHGYTFQFTYNLTVPAGKTVSVLHTCAQRRFGAMPDAKALEAVFEPFRSRKYIRDIPASVRRTIVNLRGFGRGFGAGPELLSTLEKLGVERGKADVLAIGAETRVRGTAAFDRLLVDATHGELEVPFERVAALAGARYAGRTAQIYLRDGQVVSGQVRAQKLRFTMESGLSIDLHPDTLDRLALRTDEGDGQPPKEADLFVETFDGDRLAAKRTDGARLTAVTPWGVVAVPLQRVHWASLPEENQPGHVVRLKDGSRFYGILDGPPLILETLAFGPRRFEPGQVRSLVTVDFKPPAEEEAEIPEPHAVLVGGNVLVGRVDLPRVHLIAEGQAIPVPPEQIRVLHNLSEGEPGVFLGTPMFHAELWGGGSVTGELREVVLPIRLAGRVCRVPAKHVVDVIVPAPSVPQRMRDKIARLIRDLGSAQWETREAAHQELADLGHMAKPQLAEAVKQTGDPEVKRRAQQLLDELGP
ncbi:MAG: hypothetical protein ACLF0G_01035 [Candidatus Brocadiia bacterium]